MLASIDRSLPTRAHRGASRPCRPGVASRRPPVALATALALAGPAAALGADRPVEIRFAGEFAGASFDCAAVHEGVGSTGASVRVTDYRLFVSNLALLDADGEEVPVALEQDDVWQSGDVALLDFENGAGPCDNGTPETRAVVRGSVPEGEYAGVAFDLGVPFEPNHGDPTLAGSPLNLTAMFWNWQGGYRFLKLDTLPATDGAAAMHGAAMDAAEGGASHAGASHGGGHAAAPIGAWMLHVGSSGCASASRTSAPASPEDCARPNRPRVVLDGFDPAADRIAIDPAAALAESDLTANADGTAPGCMSGPEDPDCTGVMPLLGIEWEGETAGQRLFDVRRDAP